MRMICSTASMKTDSGSGAIAMISAESLEAPGIGVGAEQVHAAVVALVGLQALEDFLRVVQHGGGRIEREIRPRLDARAVPALGLIVTDDGHVIGENPAETGVDEPGGAILAQGSDSPQGWISNFKLIFLLPALAFAVGTGAIAGAGLSPGPAGLISGRPSGLTPVPRSRRCFRPVSALAECTKSSMFAEMSLDNLAVVELRTGRIDSLNPWLVRPFEPSPRTKRSNISSWWAVL